MDFGEYVVIPFTKGETGRWAEEDKMLRKSFYKKNLMCTFVETGESKSIYRNQ